MEIGIDALPLLGRGGISRHLLELLPALIHQGTSHRYHLFVRVFRAASRMRYREVVSRFMSPRLSWHRTLLPDRLLEMAWTHHDWVLPGTRQYLGGLDVFLATAGLTPAGAPCPIVGVVHDLAPMRYPHWFASDLALIQRRLEKLVGRSRLLLAVSESTRGDLQKFLGVPADKVRVVSHGIHPRFRPASPDRVKAVLVSRQIRGPFFLFVGGFGPIKNVGTLLEAFRAFRNGSDNPHELLLAGDLRWAGSLPREVERLGLSGAVRFLGFVDDDELPALYTACTALVLPSWYESFGFPGVEAMACGAPILAARVGALPDLLGDAALFFLPDAPATIAEHMVQIAADEFRRQQLKVRGRARASTFTWERAAAETLAVLQEAAHTST